MLARRSVEQDRWGQSTGKRGEEIKQKNQKKWLGAKWERNGGWMEYSKVEQLHWNEFQFCLLRSIIRPLPLALLLLLSLSLSAFFWKWIILIFVYHTVPPSTDCEGEGRAGCWLPRGHTRVRCWCSQIWSTGLHCTGQSVHYTNSLLSLPLSVVEIETFPLSFEFTLK